MADEASGKSEIYEDENKREERGKEAGKISMESDLRPPLLSLVPVDNHASRSRKNTCSGTDGGEGKRIEKCVVKKHTLLHYEGCSRTLSRAMIPMSPCRRRLKAHHSENRVEEIEK